MKIMLTANKEELQNSALEAAHVARIVVDAYIANGFTEDQAIQILISMLGKE